MATIERKINKTIKISLNEFIIILAIYLFIYGFIALSIVRV